MASGANILFQGSQALPTADDITGRLQALAQQRQDYATGQLKQQQMQQQLQSGAMDLQAKQQAFADEKNWQRAWSEAGGDMTAAVPLAQKYGVSSNTLAQKQESFAKLAEQRAKTDDETRKADAERNTQLGGLFLPVDAETDPAKQQAMWEQARQLAVSRGLAKDGDIAPYSGPGAVHIYASGLKTLDQVNKEAQARAEQTRADADATRAKAESDKSAREASDQEFSHAISDLAGSPAASQAEYAQRVGALSPGTARRIFSAVPIASYDPQKSPGALRAIGQTAEQQATSAQASSQLTEQQKRDAETARHNKADEANAAMRERREQQIYNQTYGDGVPEALRGVAKNMQGPAAKEADDAAKAYATATEAADNMRSIVNLAKGGNKVAYSYAPVEGVLTINTAQGIKRVNLNEIERYGNAGSFMDKVKGYFGKQVSGASIPTEILNAMDQLNSSQHDNAARLYNNTLNGINQNRGTHFKPVEMGGGQQGGAAQFKAGDTRTINGVTYTRDASGNWNPAK
jgi:hypothetical protein